MQTSSASRVAKWDNIKWLMILFVVIGHMLAELISKNHNFAKEIFFFLYLFHMPVFIFLSGLFSQKTIRTRNYPAIYSYGIIYVIMKFTLALVEYGVRDMERLPFNLFYDKTPAWYALAMVAFFLITIQLENIHPAYMIPASILLACAAGYSKLMGDHYVSMRIINFYPFFLMGYHTDQARLFSVMETFRAKIVSLIVVVVTALACLKWAGNDQVYGLYHVLKGSYAYTDMRNTIGYGFHCFGIRLVWYLVACIMAFCVMTLITAKKTPFTVLGAGTLSVFMWHPLILKWFFMGMEGKKLLKNNWPTFYVFVAILIAIIITLILSQPLFVSFTKLITTLPVVDRKKPVDNAGPPPAPGREISGYGENVPGSHPMSERKMPGRFVSKPDYPHGVKKWKVPDIDGK